MPSSERRALRLLLCASASVLWPATAAAQQAAQGFAVERLYPSAPGGGWFVMDDLDMRGGLGGAISVTTGYASRPLRVTDGSQHLAVVSDSAFADVGLAVTYDRFRFYLNLTSPLVLSGTSGTVGGWAYAAPAVDPATPADLVSDPRIGFDVRLLGGPRSPFRLGAGAQLIAPNGNQSDYDTDGTFRGMVRALVAGDVPYFTYAGQLGVHVRPLDDTAPGGPRGSELLFGLAAGPKLPLTPGGGTVLVVGPEVFGQTALRSFGSTSSTGLEGLLTGRIEGTGDDGTQVRVKLGAGAGLSQHFGAPEWRLVFGVEIFDHDSDRDHDGVTDSKDACPDVPGVRTKDPKTSGCPAAPADRGRSQ